MKNAIRATFALLCAAFLAMGCGGDPGSSGNGSGDTNPDTSGSGTTQPHNVAIPVALVAGSTTDTIANLAAVSIWRNDPANPMGSMPISYPAYEADPIVVDANEKGLEGIGVDVVVPGYLVVTAPQAILLADDLKAAGDQIALNAIIARDLTGTWSCTQTITKNNAIWSEETDASAITISIDLGHGKWAWAIDKFGGPYGILGDTISSDESGANVSGTVTKNGNVLDVTETHTAAPDTVITTHCTR